MIAGASLFTDCGTLLFTDYNLTHIVSFLSYQDTTLTAGTE